MASESDIPVTVIGGYLGAGKTSLINQVLESNGDQRIAVLVNDFGAINIDASLIQWQTDQIVALSNGCVCCTIADDLGETFSQVRQWSPRMDRVILEASGVAEPAKVAMYGQGWPGFRLAGVLTVVDAVDIRKRAKDKFVGSLVQRQISQADAIVVSKTDCLSAQQGSVVRDWLNAFASDTPVVDSAFAGPSLLRDELEHHAHAAEPENNLSQAANEFKTGALTLTDPIARETLTQWLNDLPPTVVRVKGYLRFLESPDQWVLLQVVGSRVEFVAAMSPTIAKPGIVAISVGSSNDAQLVLDGLARALASESLL